MQHPAEIKEDKDFLRQSSEGNLSTFDLPYKKC